MEQIIDVVKRLKQKKFKALSGENNYTITDAIITTTLSLNMAAKLYVPFNKPHIPTKVFKSRDGAIQWLLSFK